MMTLPSLPLTTFSYTYHRFGLITNEITDTFSKVLTFISTTHLLFIMLYIYCHGSRRYFFQTLSLHYNRSWKTRTCLLNPLNAPRMVSRVQHITLWISHVLWHRLSVYLKILNVSETAIINLFHLSMSFFLVFLNLPYDWDSTEYSFSTIFMTSISGFLAGAA